MMRGLIALIAALVVAPAHAQPASHTGTTSAAELDPARLAAARAVVRRVFPAERNDELIEQMLRPTMTTMADAFKQSPSLKQMFRNDPEVESAFQAFIAAEMDRATVDMKANMPMLVDAMTNAYARRFSLDQLHDIGRFFDTPSGRAYVAESRTMMGDPDIQAAQRTMMLKSMEGLQDRVLKFFGNLGKAKGKKP